MNTPEFLIEFLKKVLAGQEVDWDSVCLFSLVMVLANYISNLSPSDTQAVLENLFLMLSEIEIDFYPSLEQCYDGLSAENINHIHQVLGDNAKSIKYVVEDNEAMLSLFVTNKDDLIFANYSKSTTREDYYEYKLVDPPFSVDAKKLGVIYRYVIENS